MMTLRRRPDPTVTSADIDLTPLSVGFDLRIHDISMDVPEDTRTMRYARGREVWWAEGTPGELADELRAAGYRILGDTDDDSEEG